MMRLKCSAIAVAALVVLAGCSKEDPQYPTPVVEMEIATFLGQDETGSQWEVQRVRDAAPVRLTAPQRITGNALPEVGRRLMINYQAALADTAMRPMPVQLIQVRTVVFDTIRPVSREVYDALPDPQVRILSRWNTEGYLNMQVLMEYDGKPRSFTVVANPATIDSDVVECKIAPLGDAATPDYVDRRTYASFYTGEIRGKVTVLGAFSAEAPAWPPVCKSEKKSLTLLQN